MDVLNIIELNDVCDDYVRAVRGLLSQLSSSHHEFTTDTLRAIVESQSSYLFVATLNGDICGMITLGCYIAPTGRKLWIEDVVVDSKVRGMSIGRKLVEYVIEYAENIGGTLMLTSRPSRIAANALYRSVGFEQKETNVYKMNLIDK